MNNLRKIGSFISVLAVCLLVGASVDAKVKHIVKPDKDYNFKAVKKIVMLPITSNKVEFGKVDAKRLPKIKSILESTKKKLRSQMVEGMNLSEPSAKFYYTAPDRSETTLLVQSNIEVFDNGNFAARTLTQSLGGKAKVTIRTKFMDAKTKKVRSEVTSTAKASGSLVGGGLDSESLWLAAKIADSSIFLHMKKLTGLKYKTTANMGKKVKIGVKDEVDTVKKEKGEKNAWKKSDCKEACKSGCKGECKKKCECKK